MNRPKGSCHNRLAIYMIGLAGMPEVNERGGERLFSQHPQPVTIRPDSGWWRGLGCRH